MHIWNQCCRSVSGIRDRLPFGPLDPGWVWKSRSGSGMYIPEHISESLETIFWVNILKFFDVDADPDPGSGNLFDPGSEIRDGKNSNPGSRRNIPDPQHCLEPDPPYPTKENTVWILGEDVPDHPGLLPGGRLLQHGHHTPDLPEPQRLSHRRYAAHAAALCRIVRDGCPTITSQKCSSFHYLSSFVIIAHFSRYFIILYCLSGWVLSLRMGFVSKDGFCL